MVPQHGVWFRVWGSYNSIRGVVKCTVIGSKVMSSNLDFKFSLIAHVKRTKM